MGAPAVARAAAEPAWSLVGLVSGRGSGHGATRASRCEPLDGHPGRRSAIDLCLLLSLSHSHTKSGIMTRRCAALRIRSQYSTRCYQ